MSWKVNIYKNVCLWCDLFVSLEVSRTVPDLEADFAAVDVWVQVDKKQLRIFLEGMTPGAETGDREFVAGAENNVAERDSC